MASARSSARSSRSSGSDPRATSMAASVAHALQAARGRCPGLASCSRCGPQLILAGLELPAVEATGEMEAVRAGRAVAGEAALEVHNPGTPPGLAVLPPGLDADGFASPPEL